jgi:hypothetical protein
MNLSTIQKRLFAWGMGMANDADANRIKLIDCPEYKSLGELKQALLGNLQHQVLEIGPGAGASLAYYPKDIHENMAARKPLQSVHELENHKC